MRPLSLRIRQRRSRAGPDGEDPERPGVTVVFGGTDFAVVRYTSSGALDPTFSGDGVKTVHVGTFGGAGGVVVQPDGKVVVVGRGGDGFTVLRLRLNGDLDPTFGNGGVVDTRLRNDSARDEAAAVMLVGNRIVVAGTADMSNPLANAFAIVRYTPTGQLDPTFGSDGIVAGRGSGTIEGVGARACPRQQDRRGRQQRLRRLPRRSLSELGRSRPRIWRLGHGDDVVRTRVRDGSRGRRAG